MNIHPKEPTELKTLGEVLEISYFKSVLPSSLTCFSSEITGNQREMFANFLSERMN